MDPVNPRLDEEKQRLRATAKARRAEAAGAAAEAGEAVAARIAEALREGAIRLEAGAPVSAYWPKGDELDPRPLISLLSGRGHPVGLPVMIGKGQPLVFRRWDAAAELVPAGFGLLEPAEDRPEVVPELLFVPLLAFDRAGWRLGYGGGFYDRTLAKLQRSGSPLAVGLAYAGQELPEVLHGPNDRQLDWIVTEREILATREVRDAAAVLR